MNRRYAVTPLWMGVTHFVHSYSLSSPSVCHIVVYPQRLWLYSNVL